MEIMDTSKEKDEKYEKVICYYEDLDKIDPKE